MISACSVVRADQPLVRRRTLIAGGALSAAAFVLILAGVPFPIIIAQAVDTSMNATRRWCYMRYCGNRLKARAFRQRHRAPEQPRHTTSSYPPQLRRKPICEWLI